MSRKRFLGFCFFFLAATLMCGTAKAAPTDRVGVLVLAHGGSKAWNNQVETAVREAGLTFPVEVAFGMGMNAREVSNIQRAVDRLREREVNYLVVVPLLVSSHSSVYRQYQYLFGLREESSWPDHPVKPVHLDPATHVQMLGALDDSPLVAEILAERARKLSRDPKQEALVIVSHGPETVEDNAMWFAAMERLGRQVQQDGGYSALELASLQDDAPSSVREEATRRLRATVEAFSASHRVLVIPLLISEGGIEEKIPQRLAGLSFVYTAEVLLPHPNIGRWLKQQVEAAVAGSLPR